jgi:hypothetical protein
MARRMLFLMLALAVAPSAAHAGQRFSGAGFRTIAPSGWTITKGHQHGWRFAQAAGPGDTDNSHYSTELRVHVSWISARRLRRSLRRRIPRDPLPLAHLINRAPGGAENVAVNNDATRSVLAGWPSASTNMTYDLDGLTTLQEIDVALNRHGRVYQVQMLASSDRAAIAIAALGGATQHWRWR